MRRLEKLKPIEKKGLIMGGTINLLITGILISLLILPSWGPLRGVEGDMPIIRSPFMSSLVPIIALLFFVPGLVYGKVTKGIRDDKDVAAMMSATMASMGMFIVLSFTAGQFVAFFYRIKYGTCYRSVRSTIPR